MLLHSYFHHTEWQPWLKVLETYSGFSAQCQGASCGQRGRNVFHQVRPWWWCHSQGDRPCLWPPHRASGSLFLGFHSHFEPLLIPSVGSQAGLLKQEAGPETFWGLLGVRGYWVPRTFRIQLCGSDLRDVFLFYMSIFLTCIQNYLRFFFFL